MDLEHPEEYDKENCGSEYIHPDWMQVAGPFAFHVFAGKKTGFYDQVFQRAEEFSIEMGEVVKEMR